MHAFGIAVEFTFKVWEGRDAKGCVFHNAIQQLLQCFGSGVIFLSEKQKKICVSFPGSQSFLLIDQTYRANKKFLKSVFDIILEYMGYIPHVKYRIVRNFSLAQKVSPN